MPLSLKIVLKGIWTSIRAQIEHIKILNKEQRSDNQTEDIIVSSEIKYQWITCQTYNKIKAN